MADNFWLSDEQWAAIAPHLPMVHTGPERQDDRRVISGIIYRLREGCRWRALPDEYGPYTTVFNRYNRWSQRGLWQRIFAALVECSGPPLLTMIDSSAVKTHRSASGARKSGRTTKPSGARAAFLLTGGHIAEIKGAASRTTSCTGSWPRSSASPAPSNLLTICLPRPDLPRQTGRYSSSKSLISLAGEEGLEPPTPGFGDRCSNQLSYPPARAKLLA